MGKKKINIERFLLLFLLVILSTYSYSQAMFTEKLEWNSCDSIKTPVFKDTTQIIEWGKSVCPIATVQSKKIRIKNIDIFLMEVDICSGIYCPSIFVFKKTNMEWQLITSSNARVKEQLEIMVDENHAKIIFQTKSSQIGELLFETLNLSSDKLK